MTYLNRLNDAYPVRRTEAEKQAFRGYVLQQAQEKGLSAVVETTKDGKNKNVVIGDPLTARVVCTAHYDTPAASLFPNIMIPRNQMLFYLYQFLPITLLLAVSIGAALGLAKGLGYVGQEFTRAFLLIYLAIYYGLY